MEDVLMAASKFAHGVAQFIDGVAGPPSTASVTYSDRNIAQSNHTTNDTNNSNGRNISNGSNNSSIKKKNNQIVAQDMLIGIAGDVFQIVLMGVASYYITRWITKSNGGRIGGAKADTSHSRDRLTNMLIDREVAKIVQEQQEMEEQTGKKFSKSSIDLAALRNKVKRQMVKSLDLNEYENSLADDVIDPSDIVTTFQDVGGIDHIKAELWDLVVLPIIRPDLFVSSSGLVSPPRGILLYGAPGTGKTMLAKAIAKESGASFINVKLSNIMDKWFGESNKLVAATFSLAQKLAPSVIFIDEIDTFLNQRDSSEGTATTSMKSEFLTLWDGMLSDSESNAAITVLGATNRPYDIDSAIQRRLPRMFEIGLPNESSRLQILELFLKKHSLTRGARGMIPQIAKVTEGYSGSDLKELCRAAALAPVREITKKISESAVMGTQKGEKAVNKIPTGMKIRPVNENDFKEALNKVKRTGEVATNFKSRDNSSNSNNSFNEIARAMQIMNSMMSAPPNEENKSEEDDDIPTMG